MSTVCTIGFTKKSLEEFATLLRQAGVDVVVDTRLRPDSQLAGYAKQRDLPFILGLLGIQYEYHPELAPTPEILDGYRQEGSWEGYVATFRPLIEARNVVATGKELFTRYHTPCLLCSEHTPEHCHRRLVAEYWAEEIPGLEIVHLY
jgi:uncharacterized protein (DUF488 family)